MKDCIFCKIIQGEVPSYKIYEDEKALAFLDINPLTRGHVLVIPKKHVEDIFEIDFDNLSGVIRVVQKVAQSLKENLGASGINLFQANKPAAGQEIFHLHFHVVPRYQNDKIKALPESNYQEKDFEEVAKKIRI